MYKDSIFLTIMHILKVFGIFKWLHLPLEKKIFIYIDSQMHSKYFHPIIAKTFSHLPSIAGVAMYRSKLMAY